MVSDGKVIVWFFMDLTFENRSIIQNSNYMLILETLVYGNFTICYKSASS